MSLTSVFLSPLSWDLFKFPPEWEPQTLPPPEQASTAAYPFNISPKLFNDMLDVKWPVTIAIVYATTVTGLNRFNKSRGNKPWRISKTGAFTFFVLAHNIFLTIYSGWTFVGMLRCLTTVFGGILKEYPVEKYGSAQVIDALCKMSGPRGMGNAATWDPFESKWSVKNTAVKLLSGSPDPSDLGRVWNEGLAFYGWLFYLSKFYEVLDTIIILAKGKRSSLLQTYHHAGAMMCMWAGIRFMSPPIWMFVQFNSGIHALMYFYYTLAALGIKVPNSVKRTLTSMQISQFIIGASFALSHLFVGYQIPVNTPYIFKQAVNSMVSSAASAIPSATASIGAAGIASWLKKGALRAAGFEGLAENVRDESGQRFGIDALRAQVAEDSRSEIRYRMEYPLVHCLDTSGQAFAIWLNCLYLAPLTYLFGRFFYISYIKRAAAASKDEKAPQPFSSRMARSSSDAARGVDREIRQAMGDAQGYNSPVDDEFAIELQDEIDKLKNTSIKAIKQSAENVVTTVTETIETITNGVSTRSFKTETSTEASDYLNFKDEKSETFEKFDSTEHADQDRERNVPANSGGSRTNIIRGEAKEESNNRPNTPPNASSADAGSPSALFG